MHSRYARQQSEDHDPMEPLILSAQGVSAAVDTMAAVASNPAVTLDICQNGRRNSFFFSMMTLCVLPGQSHTVYSLSGMVYDFLSS